VLAQEDQNVKLNSTLICIDGMMNDGISVFCQCIVTSGGKGTVDVVRVT